jgi:hypothetical protein
MEADCAECRRPRDIRGMKPLVKPYDGPGVTRLSQSFESLTEGCPRTAVAWGSWHLRSGGCMDLVTNRCGLALTDLMEGGLDLSVLPM